MLLTNRCDIFRHEDITEGNFIKKVIPENPKYSNVHCRMQQKTTTNKDAEGRVKVVCYYLLHLSVTTDIKNGDRIFVKGYDEIWKAGEPYGPAGHHKVVALESDGEV